MPTLPLTARLFGLALLTAAIGVPTIGPAIAGSAPVAGPAVSAPSQPSGRTGAAVSPSQPVAPSAAGSGGMSSAQSQEAARSAATRILAALQSGSGVAVYRLFSPNLQRMTSPALVQQRLRRMPAVKGWSIGDVEPGVDSNTVATQLRTTAGQRNLLLVIDADGLLEGYHLDAADEAAESVARRFVEELSQGRYVAAQSLLSPDLQEEIPAPKLQIKWQHLQRLTGDFVAIRRVVRAESTVDSKLVLVTTSFSRLTDSLFVILDSANRIVGVDFPSDPGSGGGSR